MADLDSFLFHSDEETGGPGGQALAQLAVFLFTSALNSASADLTVANNRTTKSPGSKRSSEWDRVAGLRNPPVKKLAVADDELGILLSTPSKKKFPF